MSPLMKNLIIVALVLFVIIMFFMVWSKFSTPDKSMTTTNTPPVSGAGVGTTPLVIAS